MSNSLDRVYRKAIAWLPMHAIYWIGILLCWLFERTAMKWGDCKKSDFLYIGYSRCMKWSVDLNDWAELKLWKKTE